MSAVYHAGEIAVQTRAGVREMAKRVGNGIHAAFSREAAEFLAQLPLVIVSSRDGAEHVWASILTGEPGFAHVVDKQTARIQANPAPGDPLAAILAGSAVDPSARLELGILAIDLETRDRMRLNGTAEVGQASGFLLHVHEVYFNCPKYIQAREVTVVTPGKAEAAEIIRADILTPGQREWVAAADTFFVASDAPGKGADASHRGGNPGFVRVRDASTLEWPDYSGNMMFNTLGNITVNPNVGLLFLDFDRGDTLQLTGQAAVVWEPERTATFHGAERLVEFHIEQAIQIDHAVPLHFRFLQYSRFNPS